MNELASWAEVDDTLQEIGRITLDIRALETDMGVKVLDLLKEYGGRLDSLNLRKSGFEAGIEAFCRLRKDQFAGKRSRQLNFGKIAFRLSERIDVPEGLEGVAIETLRRLGLDECVEVKEKLDRTALKRLADEDLVKCGLSRTVSDRFRIEPNLAAAAGRAEKVCCAPTVTIDMEKLTGAVKVARPPRLSREGGTQ
jgi:phage host-nuclease inhibitor protein Gam